MNRDKNGLLVVGCWLLAKNHKPKTINQKAFTLVEILMVLTISSLLTLGTHHILQQAFRMWRTCETRRPQVYQTNQLLDNLRIELAGAFVPTPIDPNDTGNEEELAESTPAFVLSTAEEGPTTLSFYTLTPAWSGHPGQMRYVSYRLDSDIATDTCTLIRSEQRTTGRVPFGPVTEQAVLRDCEGLRWQLGQRSESGTLAWQESFDSEVHLPQVLKLQLTWPDQGQKVTMETLLEIPCRLSHANESTVAEVNDL